MAAAFNASPEFSLRIGIAIAVATLGVVLTSTPILAMPSNAETMPGGNSFAAAANPQLELKNTIHLNGGDQRDYVAGVTFSPDSHYLAIESSAPDLTTHIIIWDLQKNKEQARIAGLQLPFAIYPNTALSWTPDGKYITYGSGGHTRPIQFWSPTTGQLVKEAPPEVLGSPLRFNRDGSKALASIGLGGHSIVRIYDTTTWTYQDFDQGPLFLKKACWAYDGQVLAVGEWRFKKKTDGGRDDSLQTPGVQTFKTNDVVARIFDPSGHLPSRMKLLIPSTPKTIQQGNGKDFTYNQDHLIGGPFLATDGTGEVIVLDNGHILDGRTLEMLTFATEEDVLARKVPVIEDGRNMAISLDGDFLYLKGDAPQGMDDTADNLILDARSGKFLLWFHGGHSGIAISPDGKKLAIGNGSSVKLFDVQ